MSPERLFDLVVFIVLLVGALRLVPSAGRILRMYTTIRSRRLEDATAFAPPEPAAVAAVADRLVALGFSRIGVRSAVLPDGVRRFEWNLVDGAYTTYVALVPASAIPGGILLACYSAFADGAFVSTTYPESATVRRRDFDAAPVGGSPEEAIRAHYQRLTDFSATHGPALENHSMADLLVRDDTYRRRHGGATIRGRVGLFLAVTGLVVIAAAVELVRLVALDH